MTKRTRYGLLIAGLIVFLVGAPSLVLYVQGRKLGLGKDRSELTGIIAAQTKPSGATITAHNTTTDTPGAIRFLPSGDYLVKIEKPGYYPWSKTLAVIESRVTHANPNPSPLLLVKQDTSKTIVETDGELVTLGDSIVYTNTENMLVLQNIKAAAPEKSFKLPGKPTLLTTDPEGSFVFAANKDFAVAVHINSGSITDHSTEFKLSSISNPEIFHDKIFGLTSDKRLLTAEANSRTADSVAIASNVDAYTVHNDELYYLTRERPGYGVLRHAKIDGNTLLQDQSLASNIPTSDNVQIYVDSTKAVFVKTNDTLFRINDIPAQIANGVLSATSQNGSLVFTTDGQLYWYDSGNNKTHLITRSSEPFTSFYVDPALQYAFFTQGNRLIALEIDDHAGQNRYELDTAVQDAQSLFVLNSETLVYKSGNSIRVLSVF